MSKITGRLVVDPANYRIQVCYKDNQFTIVNYYSRLKYVALVGDTKSIESNAHTLREQKNLNYLANETGYSQLRKSLFRRLE